jgi:Raf kinase inhibitor-like YbhB/YbcL family protein
MTIARAAMSAIFASNVGIFVAASAFADAPAKPAGFSLCSSAFVDGGELPAEFTCDGDRASPPLQWSDPPAGTKSFAITMHHTPGPGDMHVYMVVYNVPAATRALAKNARDAGVFGINTVNGKQEYTPPCSKGPGAKTYTLTVYALSAEPRFTVAPNAVTMDMLLAAIKDKTLATAAINVNYSRPDKPAGPAGNEPGTGPHTEHRGPPELQRALTSLTFTDAQKAKVDAIVQQFHRKQEQARSELLAQMKEVLDAKQYEQVENSFSKPPPPPPDGPGGNDDRPSRN